MPAAGTQKLQIILTQDDWNRTLRALAAWSGDQAGLRNVKGANDAIAIYNEICEQIGRPSGLRPIAERAA